MKEHTAILELVDSGEGFSRNDVTSPEASTSRIPNLCVSEIETLIIIIPKHHQLARPVPILQACNGMGLGMGLG